MYEETKRQLDLEIAEREMLQEKLSMLEFDYEMLKDLHKDFVAGIKTALILYRDDHFVSIDEIIKRAKDIGSITLEEIAHEREEDLRQDAERE